MHAMDTSMLPCVPVFFLAGKRKTTKKTAEAVKTSLHQLLPLAPSYALNRATPHTVLAICYIAHRLFTTPQHLNFLRPVPPNAPSCATLHIVRSTLYTLHVVLTA
eukprot:scaffold2798_cov23-Tisochrysis_lutea.AAC.1